MEIEDVATVFHLGKRLPEEYEKFHVISAVNIPRGMLEFMVWKKFVGYPENKDTSKKLYIFCRSGARAAFAAKTLRDLGFTNASFVDMKIAEWKEAGNPIEK